MVLVVVDGDALSAAEATCTCECECVVAGEGTWEERGGEPSCWWVGLPAVCVLCDGGLLLLLALLLFSVICSFGGLESFLASRTNSLAILSRHSSDTILLCLDDRSASVVGLCRGSEATPSSFCSSWCRVSSLKLLGDTNMLLGAGGFSTMTPWEECR